MKIGVRRAEKGHYRGRNLSYFLTQIGLKMATCPLINTKNPVQKRSKTVKFCKSASNLFIRKNPGKPQLSGILQVKMLEIRLSLALGELGGATSGLQAVLSAI